MFLLPIYPSLSVLGSPDLETQVGDYDESTIITAYEGDIEDENNLLLSDAGMIRSIDEESKKEVKVSQNKLLSYSVQAGDSLGKIATRFNVTTDSILWANDMVGDSSVIKPGMKLRIPPVSGVIHTIKKGDTISAIAARYEVDETTILEYNDLTKRSKLSIGKDLMIPGGAIKVAKVDEKKDDKKIASATIASKETKKPVVAKAETKKTSTETKKTTTSTATTKKSTKDSYAIKYTGNGRWFAWGNCTWYVAQHKTVTWRGNANQWLRNAKAQGVATGQTPVPWAIVQLTGRGYNRYYGHVGIVIDVKWDDIIVKDMNYRWLGEITIRQIPKNSETIDGYIYVD